VRWCQPPRTRGLFPEQVDRWRQAAQDANAQPLLSMADQKDLQKQHQDDQREIKRLQQELRRKDKALAAAVAPLLASKKIRPIGERAGTTDLPSGSPEGSGDPRCRYCGIPLARECLKNQSRRGREACKCITAHICIRCGPIGCTEVP